MNCQHLFPVFPIADARCAEQFAQTLHSHVRMCVERISTKLGTPICINLNVAESAKYENNIPNLFLEHGKMSKIMRKPINLITMEPVSCVAQFCASIIIYRRCVFWSCYRLAIGPSNAARLVVVCCCCFA